MELKGQVTISIEDFEKLKNPSRRISSGRRGNFLRYDFWNIYTI